MEDKNINEENNDCNLETLLNDDLHIAYKNMKINDNLYSNNNCTKDLEF